MKKILILLMFLGFSNWVHAGLNEADKAYKAGNYDLVFNELKPLAEQGNPEAQYKLGVLFDAGQGVVRDPKQAFFWYHQAAIQGYVKAQYNLGWMYFNGNGVAQDYAQALLWYKKSAAQGHASAYVGLGYMYDAGLGGVAQSDKQSAAWYRKAAELGNTDGQFNLGILYALGRGVPQDYKKSLFWHKKAAVQGDVEAIQSIGVRYKLGQGVKLNVVTAYTLFELASSLAPNYEEAIFNSNSTAELLSEKQIQESKALAQAIKKNFPSALEQYLKTH